MDKMEIEPSALLNACFRLTGRLCQISLQFVRFTSPLRRTTSSIRYICSMRRFYPATGLIIALFIALMRHALGVYREEMMHSLVTLAGSFVNAFLCWMLVQYVIQRARPEGYGWKGVWAISGCVVMSVLLFYVTQDVSEVQQRIEYAPRGMLVLHFLLVTRGVVIGGFLYFIAYLLRMSAQSQQSRLENERLKQENLQARLSLLQEQVSPHFLFNSLGTLRSMTHETAPREFIQKLAEVYRYLLNNRMADLVELQAELDFTRAYLHILKERFEDALFIDVRVDACWYTRKLPPATLQLLIENTVKHNVVDAEAPLRICISTEADGWLVVSNSIRRRNVTRNSLGTGLSNIRERYRILADRDIVVHETVEKFEVKVPLLTGRS